jgi:uncharacterized protein with LGFP repeats
MAQAAITAKYNALGGATGVLGFATSQLIADTIEFNHPVDDLFHINYEHGAIYFTEGTGAHAVYNDIYKKWIAAGGVESNIGYPITDQIDIIDVTGKTCSYNNFKFGGAIYWTADDGAHLIYGDIWLKWIAVGGVKSNIGYPITDEAGDVDTTGKAVRFNNFKYGGAIYWTASDGSHLIYGSIWLKWIAAGGVKSNIGYPITDEAGDVDITGKSVRFNNFKYGGAIYWTGEDGAHLIYGDIWLKWVSIGGVKSHIGYPITDEASTPSNDARFNFFKDGGAIYWDNQHGAALIYGDIYKKYIELGGPSSFLGHPITDESSSGAYGGRYNDFTGGSIYWSTTTGAHEHNGPLPEFLDFSVNISTSTGVNAGGTVDITLHSNGDVRILVQLHDSGTVEDNYSLCWAMRDADEKVYTIGYSSSIGGAGGNTNSDQTQNKPVIQAAWRGIVAINPAYKYSFLPNANLASALDAVMSDIEQMGPIVGVIIWLYEL